MTEARYRYLLRAQLVVLLLIYTWLGLTPSPGATLASVNDLVLHFSGYVVGGISASLACPRTAWWRRWLYLLGYSLAIEIGQIFVPSRSFELRDLAANGTGIGAGLALYWLLVKPIERRLRAVIVPTQPN